MRVMRMHASPPQTPGVCRMKVLTGVRPPVRALRRTTKSSTSRCTGSGADASSMNRVWDSVLMPATYRQPSTAASRKCFSNTFKPWTGWRPSEHRSRMGG